MKVISMGIPAFNTYRKTGYLPQKASDATINFLKRQGVERIFGMVGGAIMPVYDALYRANGPMDIIVGHEQGATHMAEGMAKVTGKPGVVMTTSGPGATNLVTGLANAMMDSSPLIAITGQVNSALLGNDAFQEADMKGITMSVTKHNYQVTKAEDLPEILNEAFYVAQNGRPGPVLIDLPTDVANAPLREIPCEIKKPAGFKTPYKPNYLAVQKALGLIKKAKQPVILAGGGVISAEASQELRALAKALDAPVTTTLMGIGSFPKDDLLSLGMPGMHGTGYANLALYESDLILAVGARLDDRVCGRKDEFAPKAKLIHLDIDSSEINKILPACVGIECHAKPGLAQLTKGVLAFDQKPDLTAWHKRIKAFKKRYPLSYKTKDGIIAPGQVVEKWGELLSDQDTVVTGVGQHQMFCAQFFPFSRPRSLVTSGGLGVMGFGLPAAIGAQMAKPESQVVLMDGDGSFLMNIQELATAVRYRVPIVISVFNNSYLGMVRQWQELFLDNRLSGTMLKPPCYDKVAQSFGGLGKKVTRPEELDQALNWALRASREKRLPVVLDIAVDPAALVLPMVPQGSANIDFIPFSSKD